MGEMTSKYDGMTAAQLAKTLTPAMINALDTGRNDDGTAGVLGHTNTIAALIDRGLVTAGRKNQWTDRGFRVAAFVLVGKVPTRPHAVAYDGNGGVVGSPERGGATPELVGAAVKVVGTDGGRGIVTAVENNGRDVHVQTIDGRRIVSHFVNVDPLDEHDAEQVGRLVALRGSDYFEPQTAPVPGTPVQLPHAPIGVVVGWQGSPVTLVEVKSNEGRSTYAPTDLRRVPAVAYSDLGMVEPGATEVDERLSQLAIGRCGPGNELTREALRQHAHGHYRDAYAFAIAQQLDAVRLLAARCANESWHESSPARRLRLCPECDTTTGLLKQIKLADGRTFNVGDVVTWIDGPDTRTVWRIDRLFPGITSGEPSAGMTAVDPQPKHGTRHTAGPLRLMRLVEQPLDPADVEADRQRTALDALRTLARATGVPEEMIAKLGPEPDAPAAADDPDVSELVERLVRRAHYDALRTVLNVLDGWREGAHSNHDALGHPREPLDAECWEHWHSDDVRRMVTDAAIGLGTLDPAAGHVPTDLPAPA